MTRKKKWELKRILVLISFGLFAIPQGFWDAFANPKAKSELKLIDLKEISPEILLDIRYATTNNFMKKAVYTHARCLLMVQVANQLHEAAEEFKQHGYRLKVFDCYRPSSVQYLLWKILPNPTYVARPWKGSRHSRGSAIDVTLVDGEGKEFAMGSDYDEASIKSSRGYGALSKIEKRNRQLLEGILGKHGFVGLPSEWWHFDYKNWKKYPLRDEPL